MHLLQIIGGQPWPHFLPILSLKPEKITFLTSADPNNTFLQSVEALHQAACELNRSFKFEVVNTVSKEPTIQECSETLSSITPDIINITGGTKPMSLAAYLLAQKNQIPSFYLDTRRNSSEVFELTETSTQEIPFLPLNELAEKINVRIALMAQGFSVPDSFKIPAEQDMKFSLLATKVRQKTENNKAIADYIENLRKNQFINPKRRKLFEKGPLRAALKTSFFAEKNTPENLYLQTATQCGMVTSLESGTDFILTTLDLENEGSKKLRSVADHHFKLLEGIWFELALLHHLKQQSCYSDICWSVESESDNAESIGETDLVAFNKETLTLHFISCKVDGPHSALDHIQGLRRRATKEGGKFSKAELWIFAPKSEDSKKILQKHCKEQNVSLHILSEELKTQN